MLLVFNSAVHCTQCTVGRGPRQKNGKISTELSFFAVFNRRNYLEKVWKSRNQFKLVGFNVEKNRSAIFGTPEMAKMTLF